MSTVPPGIGFVSSRRGFLRHGVGVGIGGLVAGCGRTVIGGSVGSGGHASEPGPKTPTGPTQTTDTQPSLSGAVQVNARVTQEQLGVVGTDFVGFSFEKSEFTTRIFAAANTNVVNLFKALGPGLLRIGGNSVETQGWNPAGAGQNGGEIATVDIDAFAGFVAQTPCKVIYGINLLKTTDAEAVAEAVYAVRKLGASLYAFSLGNEPRWNNNTYTGYADLKARWVARKTAILNALPTAKFVGVDGTDGNFAPVTKLFANDFALTDIELLTTHYYRLGDTEKTNLTNNVTTLAALTRALLTGPDPKLVSLLANMTTVTPTNKGFRITECNSATGGGIDGLSNVYSSALWALDYMSTVAQGGAVGVNFHGGARALYTSFAFANSSLTEVRPLYHAMLFFTMMGSGPVLSSSIDAGSNNISIYAIKTTSGYSVLFVNKEASQPVEVILSLPTAVSSATSIHLRGPGLTSKTGVTIQNGAVSIASGQLVSMDDSYQVGVSGSNPVIKVPALTAVLVKLS